MPRLITLAIGLVKTLESLGDGAAAAQSPADFPIHSLTRAQPPVIDPGPPGTIRKPPSDAVVIFGGRSLSGWRSADSSAQPARWKLADDYMEVAAGTGNIATVREFGDVQLHIEWMAPAPARGEGQERGNSGVFLMGIYEVQVLDSYHNTTYPDGQAAAIYGQYPPLVNASRPPGEWQTYDVVFIGPRFKDGKLESPAYITVFHNGVLVQNHSEILGASGHKILAKYAPHGPKGPIKLQDHN